jgi:alpha-beta hydrolase superfamily lysophospholipase
MDRTDLAPPDDEGVVDGLAYTLWRPAGDIAGGVVVLHGAGSSKERHHPFARACKAAGLAAVVPDLRGHGESEGSLDGRAVADVLTVADLLPAGIPRALRGSSMGGYLSLVAAAQVGAAGVVAICPASATGLRRGLREGRFDFRADEDALSAFLVEHDETLAMDDLETPVLLLHAEGDDRVPVAHSRELATRFRSERSRLVTTPGGHHRSIQADGDMEAFSVRWLKRTLTAGG